MSYVICIFSDEGISGFILLLSCKIRDTTWAVSMLWQALTLSISIESFILKFRLFSPVEFPTVLLIKVMNETTSCKLILYKVSSGGGLKQDV